MCKAVKSVNRFSVRATPKLIIRYVPVRSDDWVSGEGTAAIDPKLVDRYGMDPWRIRAKTIGVTSATAINWRHAATNPA